MGKSKKKKKKGGGGGEGKQKLGRRKQLQLEKQQREEKERQKEENGRRADVAIEAGLKKMAERGITKDSDLFAPIPPNEDCPICFVPLPSDESKTVRIHFDCCGKIVCTACSDAWVEALKETNAKRVTKKQPLLPQSCAFCRTPHWATKEELTDRMMKHIASNDDMAMFILGSRYKYGIILEKDEQKAFDLNLLSVELGNSYAFNTLGLDYFNGELLQRDQQKCRVCLEASARAGNYLAHHNLGNHAKSRGDNNYVAIKHYHVAAAAGFKPALDMMQKMHQEKIASRDDFLRAINVYQDAVEEQSSEERTKWDEKKKKADASSS